MIQLTMYGILQHPEIGARRPLMRLAARVILWGFLGSLGCDREERAGQINVTEVSEVRTSAGEIAGLVVYYTDSSLDDEAVVRAEALSVWRDFLRRSKAPGRHSIWVLNPRKKGLLPGT